MILTLRCSLNPNSEQKEILENTLKKFSEACNFALKKAKENRTFFRPKLHQIVYKDLRSMGLSANFAVGVINKVSRGNSYKTRHFKAKSIEYSERTLSFRNESISISTIAGRIRIPVKLGIYQKERLSKAKKVKGGFLCRSKNGKWVVHLKIEIEDTKIPNSTGKVVGIDFGQKNLVTLSTGIQFSGGELKCKRLHYRQKRSEVQSKLKKRTKGIKRLWERLSGKEKRFVDHTLHTLTRKIVDALEPGDTIAIENLVGLKGRTCKRGRQERYLHSAWPYYRFRSFLKYKAELKGIRVIEADPEYTSQKCPRCNTIDKKIEKANRCSGVKCAGFNTMLIG
jgi:IS605 OrfB family transposase